MLAMLSIRHLGHDAKEDEAATALRCALMQFRQQLLTQKRLCALQEEAAAAATWKRVLKLGDPVPLQDGEVPPWMVEAYGKRQLAAAAASALRSEDRSEGARGTLDRKAWLAARALKIAMRAKGLAAHATAKAMEAIQEGRKARAAACDAARDRFRKRILRRITSRRVRQSDSKDVKDEVDWDEQYAEAVEELWKDKPAVLPTARPRYCPAYLSYISGQAKDSWCTGRASYHH